MTPRARDAGYTLLELLIVMVIIGLAASLAAYVVPERSHAARKSAETRKVELFIQLARDQARKTGQVIKLQPNDDGNGLALSDGSRKLRLSSGSRISVRPFLRQAKQEAALTFYPDGSCSGGFVTFKSGKDAVRIRVDWLTGQTNAEMP